MGRKVAMLWHASFSIGAGVLFFYFALPRWAELVGDVSHAVGIGLRIVTGALIGLAALPVVFTLLRTRKPELGTPQLALSIRTWSIVAHVLAGVLIIGTSISEIWFSLDKAGPWLFAIYGAAAAIAVLGFFAFYLSFVAELPPPPPKPIKPKKAKKSRGRAKRGKGDEADVEDTDDEDDDETDETDEAEDAADSEDSNAEEEKEEEATVEAEADDASDTETTKTVAAPAEVSSEKADRPEPESVTEEETTEEVDEASAETVEAPAAARLRNRRPTGKTSHRRRRTRGGVAVDE
ncbi:MAG: hypothetical protein QOD58_436 [Mycobacterium sp.]|jgi:hypothetical protein|nr:hypothetical protein [Mycobacterium sp.]